MRKFLTSKKGLALLATMIAAVATAVGAYAYFTTTGSGTGSATVGTSTALTITQTGSVSNLLPGGASQSISYTVNNTLAGDQYVGAVSASVTSVDQTPAGALAGTCDASDFSFTAAASAPGDIAGNTVYNSVAATQPSISMVNKASSQDGCKGATVHLSLNA
jgi:hypothetical protein